MQQEQMNDSQMLRAMTEFFTTTEFMMMMKGYMLGYLGIPLNQSKIEGLMSMMDLYPDLIETGTISRQNFINILLESLKKVKSFHNRSGNHQDFTQSIKQIQWKVEELAQKVINNENYFSNFSRAYYPKEEILMALNFSQTECMICSEIMDPEQACILDCTHVYHYSCLYQHVKNSIQGGQMIVKCPSEHCGIEFGQEELMNFMTPELEKRRESSMMNQYVQRNGSSTSWCPTPDCNFLFEFDPFVYDFLCRNCHKRYCLKCRCEFHDGMTCQEYREYVGMSQDDQQFLNFARGAKFKQCPRCRFWVQKNLGCPSMKCRCQQEFCYECGGVTCPHGVCSKNMNQNNLFLPRRT